MARFLVLATAIAVLAACNGGSPAGMAPAAPAVPATAYPEVQVLDHVPQAGEVPSDPVTVASAVLDGSLLTLLVDYDGGCGAHTFVLYGVDDFQGTQAPQAVLYLSHDAHGDSCASPQHAQIIVDVAPLGHLFDSAYQQCGVMTLKVAVPGEYDPVDPLPDYDTCAN